MSQPNITKRQQQWLDHVFATAANASANLYSLVESVKANGLEPYAYLKMVLTELPAADLLDDIERMLPFNQADSQRMTA